MNNALTFLGIAAAIAVVGGLVVALFHRRPEAESTDGVDQFQRIMDALAPEDDGPGSTPGGPTGGNGR